MHVRNYVEYVESELIECEVHMCSWEVCFSAEQRTYLTAPVEGPKSWLDSCFDSSDSLLILVYQIRIYISHDIYRHAQQFMGIIGASLSEPHTG